MKIAIRHAWLQKHPSPAAGRGEFHWYPPDGDRELRASFVERSRGIEAPAVLWQLAPGRVSWARVFAATAPIDGRRYVGLVLTTAEAEGASPADLLEALEVPEAAPWSEGSEAGEADEGSKSHEPRDAREGSEGSKAGEARDPRDVREGSEGSKAGEPRDPRDVREAARESAASAVEPAADRRLARARRWSARGGAACSAADDDLAAEAEAATDWQPAVLAPPSDEVQAGRFSGAGSPVDAAAGPRAGDGAMAEVAAIARALLGGGDAALAEPDRVDLPRLVASVERSMPSRVARTARWGAWRTGAAPQVPDRVAGLAAAAWREPGSRAARAWTLLCELASAKERTADEVAAELGVAEQPAAALTDGERAALGGARDFAATLHAWGRGRLDAVASAATLPSRLADAVALRVLACLVADRDPRGPIAEARWHALLPAARRVALLDAVGRRAASLRALVEVHDA